MYSNYQQHWEDGKFVGTGRGEHRFKMIFWDWFKDKSVLDMGCSNGMLAIEAKRRGASRVVGVDKGDWIKNLKYDGVDFWKLDIESSEFLNICPKFDIIFFCSMLGHIKKQKEMLQWIDKHCDILYFESNYGENNILQIDWVKKYTSFNAIECVGSTNVKSNTNPLGNEGARYMWVCYRKGKEWNMPEYLEAPLTFLPVSELDNPSRHRTYSEEKYNIMKENIKENGILHPLVCRQGDNMLVEGGHRFLIAKELGYEYVPCKILKIKYPGGVE